MSTPTPRKVSWLKSAGWTLVPIAVLPAALAFLWVAGRASTSIADWVRTLGITWANVGWGALVIATYAILVAVVHAVRRHSAEARLYRRAQSLEKA